MKSKEPIKPVVSATSGTTPRTLNYFFYKCGEANCWLPLAREGHGLYVGFGDNLSPTPEHEYPIAVREPEAAFRILTREDDDNIAWLSHVDNRQWLLLITFSPNDLIFWEVSDKLQVHRPRSEVFRRAQTMWEQFPGKKKKKYQRSFQQGAVDPLFKTLPATKLAAVPRRMLYASIDSLAVYQFLNRGTCRPIWRIGGTKEAAIPEQIAKYGQPSVRNKGDAETEFATFVRLYLNSVLRHALNGTLPPVRLRLKSQTTLASAFPDRSASHQEILALVLSTLNPILVETAALYFCLDLGLIADIGRGKGIDVIDIRGPPHERWTPS